MESSNLPPGMRPTEEEVIDGDENTNLHPKQKEAIERILDGESIKEAASNMNLTRKTFRKLVWNAVKNVIKRFIQK